MFLPINSYAMTGAIFLKLVFGGVWWKLEQTLKKLLRTFYMFSFLFQWFESALGRKRTWRKRQLQKFGECSFLFDLVLWHSVLMNPANFCKKLPRYWQEMSRIQEFLGKKTKTPSSWMNVTSPLTKLFVLSAPVFWTLGPSKFAGEFSWNLLSRVSKNLCGIIFCAELLCFAEHWICLVS